MTDYRMDGYQVIFNGTDYQVQRYPGRVVTYCESREIAEADCRLLSDWRRMLLDAMSAENDRT